MDAALNQLLDDLEDSGREDDPGSLVDAFESWASSTARPLYPHQEEALLELASGSHVIAQTPTGSGKSMIALAAHFISLARGERSYYSAPLKALVSEKFFDLVELFGPANVGLITGDVSLNPGAPIICCTAEILANQVLREGTDLDADTVVMDEFHFYADPQRGWAWQVPLMELTTPQFVLLSATLGDTSRIAEELEESTGRAVSVISDAKRPVPLEFDYLVDPLPTVVERLMEDGLSPVYIVHFTQADAVKTAVDLARTLPLQPERKEELKRALAGQELSRGFGKKLRELLLKGVGVHHAGMLPRYRRLVEQLAQQGLLSIICGTDTLGVGINVPIRTVLFTSLVKFDGRRVRHLSAREFHQIAGRAGRPGFDDSGSVRALATEEELQSAARKAKMSAAQEAGDDAKRRKLARRAAKAKNPVRKTKKDGISWNRATFDRLVESEPETLVPRFQTSHSMFLNVLASGENAEERLISLAERAWETQMLEESEESPNRYLRQLGDIYRSLLEAGLVERTQTPTGTQLRAVADLPDEFALNQPLTPFALAALDLLDPESPEFSLDVISVIESVMEDPKAVLFAQQRKERDAAYALMRDEGLDYQERKDRIDAVTWQKPLEELLLPAFEVFASSNPWVRSLEPSPKRILREMVEEGLTFSQFVAKYDLTTSEGLLLRYLSDTYRALRQVLPERFVSEQVEEVTAWLQQLLGSIDSSLLSEWEGMMAGGSSPQAAPPAEAESEAAFGAGEDGEVRFSKNPHALARAIRNEAFKRVELLAFDNFEGLAAREPLFRSQESATGDGFETPGVWHDLLGQYWDEHDQIEIGPEARANELFSLTADPKEADLVRAASASSAEQLPPTEAGDLGWMLAEQTVVDPEGHGDWRLTLLVDKQATLTQNKPVLQTLRFAKI